MQKLSTVMLIICGLMLLVSITIRFWSVIKTAEFWLNAGILVGFVGVTIAGIIKFVHTNNKE